ncbi:VCBS repeat-containing protein [Chelativorans sp. AA-79]|uniref:FG-GAP repeat domain-containing protein n=1 Tax=Chelativorans sp. AA-79 TaxID=3028735 RepID=UPI0023F9CDD8|nr:VCBS repeat-containing protein [Chelativorans sp. AA-79]WEX08264.1 VCBS repeat-containing protein [Chelativorans sp. AA-79]
MFAIDEQRQIDASPTRETDLKPLYDQYRWATAPYYQNQQYFADVTGDGLSDWVYTDAYTTKKIYVVPGTTDGTFDTDDLRTTDMAGPAQTGTWSGYGSGNGSTHLADVTGDGVLDLVHANYNNTGRSLRVFAGLTDANGVATGEFDANHPVESVGPGAYYWSNYTQSWLTNVGNDRGLAWVHLDMSEKKLNVYYFQEDGHLRSTPSVSTDISTIYQYSLPTLNSGNSACFLKDVNQDGNVDLVWGYYPNNDIRVLLGNDDGTFDTRAMKQTDMKDQGSYWTGHTPGSYPAVDLVDATGDGFLDWVVRYPSGNLNYVRIYSGEGDGTFNTDYTESVVPWFSTYGGANYIAYNGYSNLAWLGEAEDRTPHDPVISATTTRTSSAPSLTEASADDGGAGLLQSTSGGDVANVGSTGFGHGDAGSGTGSLSLSGGGIHMDFSQLDIAKFHSSLGLGAEVDLTGGGSNSLTLTAEDVKDVLDQSNQNELRILGDADDTIDAAGFTDTGRTASDGDVNYHVYETADGAQLWVDEDAEVVS